MDLTDEPDRRGQHWRDTLKVTATTAQQQEKITDAWLARHASDA
jgi:hypothetical protein